MTLNARFILKCASWTPRLSYVCCGFQVRPYGYMWPEGRRGSGLESLDPLSCGQLTRCFSAVAELLVLTPMVQEFEG